MEKKPKIPPPNLQLNGKYTGCNDSQNELYNCALRGNFASRQSQSYWEARGKLGEGTRGKEAWG